MHLQARITVLALICMLLAACGPGVAASEPLGSAEAPSNASTGATGATSAPAAPSIGTVAKIVDGDTIDVELGGRTERVRLIGIDTPESVKPNEPVECFGVEASHHLATLLPLGTEVELVRDAELRDAYDRLLAYVFRHEDGLFVNLAMAADGYAGTLTFPPNVTFAEDLRAAVAAARQAGLGLWAACSDPDALFS
ncbi:MAG: thermonuclease family protein [Acidimicrobiales bacterium]